MTSVNWRALGLDDPSELQEGKPFSPEEEAVYAQVIARIDPALPQIVPKRMQYCIIRGFWGYPDRINDTAEAFRKIGDWRKTHDVINIVQR
jgi:hypothetical protein